MYLDIQKDYAVFNSTLAQDERNDCFVRALAVAGETNYQTAHQVAKEFFQRKNKKGVLNIVIKNNFKKAASKGITLGVKKANIEVLGGESIKNKYKVGGELVWRKKTLKSFIQSHPKGNFIVTVAKHAVALINGELADWGSEAFKPTRKVNGAYKIVPEKQARQLSLFE